ncbi:MAG: energy transducer TonB [Flavobacteriales bacterium]|nr:energy transducer TonB [Flavobacteriales bacterium]
MEAKKSPEADLEKRKGSFMLIGLLTALAVSLVAFEWTTFEKVVGELGKFQDEQLEEEIIPASATPPPPPPPPPAPAEMIEIVDDKIEVPETKAVDTESTAETTFEAPPQRQEEEEDDTIFTIVEDQPQFPGGDKALYAFLGKNMKYPAMAQDANIQGTVYVTFEVDKDGQIKDVKVLRGIGGGCDEEAIRVVKSMPKWTPGKQRGKPVRVQYNLPVKFTLR